MSAKNKKYVLSLYRMLARESRKFPAYMYRMYFTRKVKEGFRDNQKLTDPKEIEAKIKFAEESLQMIRRQVIIGYLYKADKIAVEK